LATVEDRSHNNRSRIPNAKKRYRAKVKAAKDWEKRAGVDALSKSLDGTNAFSAARISALASSSDLDQSIHASPLFPILAALTFAR